MNRRVTTSIIYNTGIGDYHCKLIVWVNGLAVDVNPSWYLSENRPRALVY